jgi:hypothetical protein
MGWWKRPIARNAVACGAAALLGWIVSELVKGASGRWYSTALTCGLVGTAVGIGLTLSSGFGKGSWKWQLRRIWPGLIVGGFAGVVGGSVGNLVFTAFHRDRTLGWMVMGAGLGAIGGLHDRSVTKLASGLIGGAVGGLLGGLLFILALAWITPISASASRATGFVALAASIGAMIAVMKRVLAEAWLIILDGDQSPGRLILDGPSVLIGRADHADLKFQGRGQQGVDQEHARIVRRNDGRYVLEDNRSRHGTSVNFRKVLDRVVLDDGDVIRIGDNSIRFRSRRGKRGSEIATARPSSPDANPPIRTEPIVPASKPTGDSRPTTGVSTADQAARSNPTSPKRPVGRGVSSCPKCHRIVLGSRPYCVACKLSF